MFQPLSEISSHVRQREHNRLSKSSPRVSFLISASPLLGLEAGAGMWFWQALSKSKLLALWTEKHTPSPLTAASLQGNKLINEQDKRPGLESLAKQKGCGLRGVFLQVNRAGAAVWDQPLPLERTKGFAARNTVKDFALGTS